jgi:hypothetical protein
MCATGAGAGGDLSEGINNRKGNVCIEENEEGYIGIVLYPIGIFLRMPKSK